jgi:hypothetical protein
MNFKVHATQKQIVIANGSEAINLMKEVTMALSSKYGKISIPKVGENEPVFILRAQDILAEPALEMYRALVASHSSPLAGSVQKEIESFRKWGGSKKVPD